MSKLVMPNTIKLNTKCRSVISNLQDLKNRLKVDLPLTGVSNRSTESNTSIFNPNAKAKDKAMNECDAPKSIGTRAKELNTKKVLGTIEVLSCGSCYPTVLDGPAIDVIV